MQEEVVPGVTRDPWYSKMFQASMVAAIPAQIYPSLNVMPERGGGQLFKGHEQQHPCHLRTCHKCRNLGPHPIRIYMRRFRYTLDFETYCSKVSIRFGVLTS